MTDEPAPSPSIEPPKKLSMEELQQEIEGMWSNTLTMDGGDSSEAWIRLFPPQIQALKQVSELLLLLIPRKADLAAMLRKK